MARPGRPALPKPDLSPHVDAFLDMLTAERGAAHNTRQAYWRDLADVSLYLRDEKSVEIQVADTDQLKSYLKNLSEKANAKATQLAEGTASSLGGTRSLSESIHRPTSLLSKEVVFARINSGHETQNGAKLDAAVSVQMVYGVHR